MTFRDIMKVLVLSIVIATVLGKPRRSDYQNKCDVSETKKNLTALWAKVNAITNPIQVIAGGHYSHSHGSHDKSNHSHHHHHGHGSHSSHYHGSHYNDKHLHIHLTLNGEDNVRTFKDEYVYARCDMKRAKNGLPVSGSILMRQKPHKAIETIINLRGFKGASEGVKDGKHDFFFDIHEFADLSNGCDSLGGHDHVHEHGEGDGHDHDHDHDHDDWGNVIINSNGKVKMEVNTTRHHLFGPESILGRGIVLHDKDDKNMCCCAITYANINDDEWGK